VPNFLTVPSAAPATVPNVLRLKQSALILIVIMAAMLPASPILPAQSKSEKAKLPKPTILEKTVRVARDPTTGELRTGAMDGTVEASGAIPPIRARVTLVSVNCSVTAPDGTRIRGLGRDDFRVFEDGVAQTVASFDAAETPASIAVILDSSPSIYREFGEMHEAARSLSRSLAPEDEVAVVAFAAETELLLPFSRNRELLSAALASPELARVANSSQSFIYEAVYLTAAELFRDRAGRKAIVLLTDGQDSGLGLTWDAGTMQPRQGAASPLAFEDVARELAARGIELYVISTEHRPQAMTEAWLDAHRGGLLVTPEARKLGMPQYTLYLAEMVREVGGGLYFLREIGGLAEVYHRIALTLGAEYTLGYYPAAGIAKPGWRSLRVELRPDAASPKSQITHRAAYYVPAVPSRP
jgi:Ca-activated chloride channel family protein